MQRGSPKHSTSEKRSFCGARNTKKNLEKLSRTPHTNSSIHRKHYLPPCCTKSSCITSPHRNQPILAALPISRGLVYSWRASTNLVHLPTLRQVLTVVGYSIPSLPVQMESTLLVSLGDKSSLRILPCETIYESTTPLYCALIRRSTHLTHLLNPSTPHLPQPESITPKE